MGRSHTPEPGDVVIVRLYDAREIVGTVQLVRETVSGVKVRVLSGQCVFNLDAGQIVQVIAR